MSGLESILIKAKGAINRGDSELAQTIYRQALERYPRNRRLQAAIQSLSRGASSGGSPAQRQLDAMVDAYKAGRMEDAVRLGDALLETSPGHASIHNLKGAALLALGKVAEAEAAFRCAIVCDPAVTASYNNLAIALLKQHKPGEAEAVYREAMASDPSYAEAPFNLANLLQQDGRLAEAAALYARAASLAPDNAEAHYKLGYLQSLAGRHTDAVAAFERAAQLRPTDSTAQNNLGSEMVRTGQIEGALRAFRRALEVDPANTSAMVNLGKALVLIDKLPEAVAAFRLAVSVNPRDGAAHLNALFHEAHICDWHARGEYAGMATSGMGEIPPFASLPFVDDPAHQLARSRAHAKAIFPARTATLPTPAPAEDGRIRIGYFSADLHDHATMYLFAGVLRAHDRSRFAVHAYSYGMGHDDTMRRHILDNVDSFREVGALTDEQIAERARADNLDIAIDLKGYTRESRSQIFGLRPAPVQVNYLGYPGSMGHGAIDYFIGDAVTLPPGAETFFDEKLVRLAGSYQPNDDTRAIVADTSGRAAHGLPEDGFVFCCFNHTYKISPREFAVWMRLLGKVEGSVLWLLRSNSWAEANLRREAEAHGIDPARLVFAPAMEHCEHLGRLALADLFLDTFAVNAHTTASDALWAGLPVLTLAGRQFAARVAASLVHAVGVPELATTSEQDYEQAALDLATDPGKLGILRQRIARGRHEGPLFRTEDYTGRLERAYAEMHRRHSEGLAPDHIAVG